MPDSLTLQAGETESLPVVVLRDGFDGPVDIRLDGLPLDVTATWRNMGASISSTRLTLKAAAGMEPGQSKLKVVAVVEGNRIDETEIRLVVEKPAPAEKPVVIVPEKPAGVQQRDVLHDGPRSSRGAPYPGSKGKKGMCVLMLHDLDSQRATPAWRHLAEALQAEGHTVLTFDFRGHGESTRIDLRFWEQSVNQHLPAYEPSKLLGEQPTKIEAVGLPGVYVPWLVHDIAAARMFLDLRHDDPDSPVNTFNLVLLGAGQASALGSLWLASEGVRYEPVGEAINVQPPPATKISILQAVWLGLEAKLNGQTFPVYNWLLSAREAPVVPVAFVYGAADVETGQLLQVPLANRLGDAEVIPAAKFSGLRLLEKDPAAEKLVHEYLKKSLGALKPQQWAPRHIKQLRSYWRFSTMPKPLFFEAKRTGDAILQPLPLRDRFDIQMPGLKLRPHGAGSVRQISTPTEPRP